VEEVRREEVDVDGVAGAIEGEDVEGEFVHFLLSILLHSICRSLGRRGDWFVNWGRLIVVVDCWMTVTSLRQCSGVYVHVVLSVVTTYNLFDIRLPNWLSQKDN
jgi:hypothetical protein